MDSPSLDLSAEEQQRRYGGDTAASMASEASTEDISAKAQKQADMDQRVLAAYSMFEAAGAAAEAAAPRLPEQMKSLVPGPGLPPWCLPGGVPTPRHGAAAAVDVTDYADRVAGVLLGTACGDVLGAAVENMTDDKLAILYPEGLTSFQKTERGLGCYTDDTQMTIALTRSLVRKGRCDGRDAARAYADEYQEHRGYGGSAGKIMLNLLGGADWRTVATACFPTGSWANGGAMRIAPAGLAYRHATPEALLQAVKDAVACTHVHHIGVDGAFVQAAAVAALCCMSPPPSHAAAAAAAAAPAASPTADVEAGSDAVAALTGPAGAAAESGAAEAGEAAQGIVLPAEVAPGGGDVINGGGTAASDAAVAATAPAGVSDVCEAAASKKSAGPCEAEEDAPASKRVKTDGGDKVAPAGAAVVSQPLWLLQHLAATACTWEMREKLQKLDRALGQVPAASLKTADATWEEHLQSVGWTDELSILASVSAPHQMRASDAVAAALCAVCHHWEHPEDAVVAAVHYGGDTDTIACMAGAMMGALYGTAWLPPRWLGGLENGSKRGRDEMRGLAAQLALLRCGL